MSNKDRNFRPARRRSFDDDNYQPPTRDFGFASRPSVLRSETPSGPPVRAIVKWYNPDKGFGFIELADGSGDAFLHVSVVERNGGSSVLPGATLEVRAGLGPKGPQVTEILSVDTSTASQEQPRRERPDRASYQPADRTSVEEHGTVKWYNSTKGFTSSCAMAAARTSSCTRVRYSGRVSPIWLKDRVAVDVADGQKGPEAVGLRLI